MKQALLVLLVFLTVSTVTAATQQNVPNLSSIQPGPLFNVQSTDSPGSDERRVSASNYNGEMATLSQEQKPAEDQKKKPPPTTQNPNEIKRPPIEASMVGYIDNAIVGSEVRIRFNAAFNDAFPDRAEFIYAKCGCYRFLGFPAPGPGPGIPKNVNYQILSLLGEYAVNRRFSAFVEVPFRWIQPQGVAPGSPPPLSNNRAFPNGAGISDVQAGMKFALLASPRRYLTAQLQSYFPSGSARQGLGTNHYSLEPALLYYQRISDRFEVEAELGGWLPISGSSGVPWSNSSGFAGNIFFYGIGPSYKLYNGEHFRLAPVIEFVGWTVTGGFQTGPGSPSASGINILNVKIGARMTFGRGSSLYVGYGKALTSADWYDQIVRVEYRYAF
jgi:hypothetical protein